MSPSEEILSTFFLNTGNKSNTIDYPDIFKNLFLELGFKLEENMISLKLLLIVTCKATLQEKMQQLKVLICAPEQADQQADVENIERSRT